MTVPPGPRCPASVHPQINAEKRDRLNGHRAVGLLPGPKLLPWSNEGLAIDDSAGRVPLVDPAAVHPQIDSREGHRTFVRWIGQHLDLDRDPGLDSFPVGARSRDFFNQLLFSYKINPLTVLFLGYSDTHAGTESIDLTQQRRTLFLKVGYAWQL